MKLKLDENVPIDCLESARAHRHDAESVPSEGMAGWADEEIWPVIQRERRLLVTLDRGFADARVYPLGSHCGVLLLRPRGSVPMRIVDLFESVLEAVDLDELSGCLVVADPSGIRVRRP